MTRLRRCLDCPTLTPHTRCPEHTRSRDRARGSRQDRGYDAQHEAVGREHQHRMDAGETYVCWRCDRPLGPRRGIDWQLGHCDDDRTVHHGPEHPGCNLATSGRTATPCPHVSHAT